VQVSQAHKLLLASGGCCCHSYVISAKFDSPQRPAADCRLGRGAIVDPTGSTAKT